MGILFLPLCYKKDEADAQQLNITMQEINKEFLDSLFEQAKENPRLRQNLDLRTSSADTSQRMLNALLPRTVVPIHRHPQSNENVLLLCGKLVERSYKKSVIYWK